MVTRLGEKRKEVNKNARDALPVSPIDSHMLLGRQNVRPTSGLNLDTSSPMNPTD